MSDWYIRYVKRPGEAGTEKPTILRARAFPCDSVITAKSSDNIVTETLFHDLSGLAIVISWVFLCTTIWPIYIRKFLTI